MSKIYPMAFMPDCEVTCSICYVGFPKAWKETLIRVEKIMKPRWDGTYALPTYALKNSLGVWMDGVIELAPLKINSNDEMWAISCDQEIDIPLLYEHIRLWLHSYYLGNKRLQPKAKTEILELLKSMKVRDLEELKGSRRIRLFDEKGVPTENYSFSAFSLMVTNRLVGKKIMIDGHEILLNYAGKNQLISDIQGEGNGVYSYGISFSLQTIPPERKAVLLCDCSIHRWIPESWKERPYLHEDMIAHVWGGNNRIYKLPIVQTYKRGEEYYWKEVEEKYYNLYNYKSLPAAREVVDAIDTYLNSDVKITCLYKNGMDSAGFVKNTTGTGVSMGEKHDIYTGVWSYLSDIVRPLEGVERASVTKNARRKLKVDEINFGKELTKEQRNIVANRIKQCVNTSVIHFEVYYMDYSAACAEKIVEKLQNIFESNENITFRIRLCKLGSMGEMLEENDEVSVSKQINKTSNAPVLKRINEIKRELDTATETTACIVLLPGKDSFEKGDPKAAIRCGFALKNRLTQFIVPWDAEKADAGVDNKIVSAIEDLCRQLGYTRELDEKVKSKEEALIHTPVIGMHIMTQVNAIYGRARFLPIFVELDYVTGRVYAECDVFEQTRVPYAEAALELARLSLDKEFEKKCDNAARGVFKQRMIMWKNVYKDENVLVLIEANGNTRALCSGITDGQIQKYNYLDTYCPEEIEVGTKENSYKVNLNGSKVRFIRIRRNGEVPDYFTEESGKGGFSAASGIFKYEKDYWSIAPRPNDKSYLASYKATTYTRPHQKFAARDMIEIYPIQLQKGDNPDEWVNYANSLRMGAIQYDEAMVVPIPLHLAGKLEEYVLGV